METKWLTPREVAAKLRVHPGTLANWRLDGEGPAFIRVGHSVRYCMEDLITFVTQNRIDPRERARA